MTSDRKLLWATWFSRICLLFGTLGCLFAGYVSSFVESDMAKSYMLITVALMNSMLFFSTFPGHRIDIRFSQIKSKLSERTDFDGTLPAGPSIKNDVRSFTKFSLTLLTLTVLVIINFLLAYGAYSKSDHPAVFSHMVVIIAASFVFNACLLMYKVDETFKRLEGLISHYKKDQTSE